ncbi:MAG: FAD-dependent oxidoreductase, partial [Gammaproteobacteria bacterium]|nr:FAD-dependent oxidoreductase [Gammaproteobacteria bacterium]
LRRKTAGTSMHVVVVGAGVVGVTTAYYLADSGCEVTVIDRDNDVAGGASLANGGQLSYTFTDALATPRFITKIPSLIAGRDIGSRVRLHAALLPWGLRFLGQCTSKKAEANTLAVLKTALRSAELMAELRQALPFDFAHRTVGKLVLLSSDAELEAARASVALKRAHGADINIVSADEAFAIEPALLELDESPVAAIYSGSDAVADSRLFSIGLRDWLQDHAGVTFMLGHKVTKLRESKGRFEAVVTDDGEVSADAAVVCGGAWSGQLLRPLGIDPHIYPMRGYSVTLPAGTRPLTVSATAQRHRIVFSRIHDRVRIAGYADFRGFRKENDAKRIETLVDTARRFAPLAADYAAEDQQSWGGFRPMTPDGRARVGKTRIDGLYLNTGHGMLGWTLACASGFDVARCVAGEQNNSPTGTVVI